MLPKSPTKTQYKRSTSPYDHTKVKLIISITEHHRGKLYAMAKMYGVSMSFLLSLMIDNIYYEPLSPRLPQRLDEMTDRTIGFFVRNKGQNRRGGR